MAVPLTGKLEDFEVSQNGFLPEELPLQRLTGSFYESWELVLDQLPLLLSTSSLRSKVDELEVLSTARLSSQREWQRAYLILSFLTHAYIWESGGPSEVSSAYTLEL
jgi:indoleamine 2,3-dioxygenase